MRKFLVNVQFLGKQYFGFQINGDKKTIELTIESALKKLFDEQIKIDGCSRTDSGVSAKEFFFTFLVDTKLPADRVAFKLNRFLPADIQCQASREVPLDFLVRQNIASKTYEYSIYVGEHVQPLLNRFAVFVPENLDIKKMKDCASALVGKHNFKSFCNYSPDTSTFVREIKQIQIVKDGNLFKFYITANGFLYNMVRVLVGTLIECGKGKLCKEDIKTLFEICDRSKNPAKTMSPKGLVLYQVQFKQSFSKQK